MKKFILTMLVVFSVLPAFAQDFQYQYEGHTLKYEILDQDEKTCHVAGNSGVEGDLIIPDKANYNGTSYTVKGINDEAFYECSELTSVNIPDGVSYIGFRAFFGCSGLTTIKIPNSVSTLSEQVFSYCTSLTSVEIPSSVTKIFSAFVHCSNLVSIEIPNSVSLLGISAFEGCTGLKSVRIGNGVEYIGNNAFYGCSNLVSIEIPNSVSHLGYYAFENCTGLKSVRIGNGVEYIGDHAFTGCSSLQKAEFSSIEHLCNISFGDRGSNPLSEADYLYIDGKEVTSIEIPESVSSLRDYSFTGYANLNSLAIGNSVTSIGNYAFYRCTGLTSVVIPNSVTEIGYSAFEKCTGLRSVIIGTSIAEMGSSAFAGCAGLIKSAYPNTIDNPFPSGKCISYNAIDPVIENGWVYGPDKKEIWFAPLDLEGDFSIPDSVTGIGDEAFFRCLELTAVRMPESVTSIGNFAFFECSGISSVEISQSVTYIGIAAFSGCSSLASVEFPKSLTYIGWSAFSRCSALTSIVIPKSVTSIGSGAFSECYGLASARFEDGLEEMEVGNGIFGNTPISNLYWGRQAQYIQLGTDGIKTLVIGNSLESIPESSFSNLRKLTDLTLGSGLKNIGASAFSGCSALKAVVLPPLVEMIGEMAFENTGLDSVVMGSKIKEIGDRAFYGCKPSSINITTSTPPIATNNTFSYYDGNLWVEDMTALEAYHSAKTCWNNFDIFTMVTPTSFTDDNSKALIGSAGDQIQLSATLLPENVTLPQVFWRSTNPAVATVDENGLVTLHIDVYSEPTRAVNEDADCIIIASTMYADVPDLEFIVGTFSGINDPVITDSDKGEIDYTAPYNVYSINGYNLGNDIKNLSSGIYIIRQGNTSRKIAVK